MAQALSGAAAEGGELLAGVRWLAGAHSEMKVRTRPFSLSHVAPSLPFSTASVAYNPVAGT